MRIFNSLVLSLALFCALASTAMAGFRDDHQEPNAANLRGTQATVPTFWNTFEDATANDGPWIIRVTRGHNANVAQSASDKANANKNPKKAFKVKYNFVSSTGVNAIAVDGISLADLRSLPFVESIESDAIKTVDATASWGIDRIDQANLPLSNSYSPDYTGCGVNVYVLDTGLDTTHTEFTSNQASTGRVIQNIFNAYGAATDANTDGHGHGTHCSGTIGGATVGVATCTNIFGMKILSDAGSGYNSDIIAALDVVKTRHQSVVGAKSVVSMSLGGQCASQYCPGDSLVAKVNELASLGIVSSVAAGNSNMLASLFSPAAAASAITVAASTSTDAKASYSNFGLQVDIYAPGSSITSACSSKLTGCTTGTSYSVMSGTSMAAPHVSGVLAQQIQRFAATQAKTTWSTLSDVNDLRASLLCDSVVNKVTGNPTGTEATVTTLLNQAKSTSTCVGGVLEPSAAPSETPTGVPSTPVPTVASTVAPTRNPTRAPTRTPTRAPVVSPTRNPTRQPTRRPTKR